MATVSSLDEAVELLAQLHGLAVDGERAALDARITELGAKLDAARREADQLQERIASLESENRTLKQAAAGSDEPVEVKNGCYRFDGDDALYCPLCWDNKRHKARTTRISSRQRVCGTCRSPVSA
ncbi:hypothetical protein [Aquisalimonas asiatica]|uniref:Uncharacterized protein n=1 Tax=Aquisalimonas asiatica TaxID=406100 RepID=A0A1H8UZR8_9GAMM|nr:hypothetical protein [Aquisalimonas asiatica]SEP08464.1 hypothetical protein SAMN04488052_1096 [Aquisalimonas asiatica]